MCDSVVRYAFRFRLSLTITCHTSTICVITVGSLTKNLPRTRDRFLERYMHRIVVQGWNFTFLPRMSS